MRAVLSIKALLLIAGAGLLTAAQAADEVRPPWRVVVLHGGDSLLPGSLIHDQAMREALMAMAARPIDFYPEALDTMRFPGPIVEFRQPSFWERYRGGIVAAGMAAVIQSALIVALLVERRRRAELEAHRQRSELAHASRLAVVGELSASIAHQINQPLGAILSNAEATEMLLDSNPPPSTSCAGSWWTFAATT